jgi:hypothetical protein
MASSLIVAGLLGPAPAIADTGMEDDVAQVEFGALEDASFSEVYDAIRASNESDTVAGQHGGGFLWGRDARGYAATRSQRRLVLESLWMIGTVSRCV